MSEKPLQVGEIGIMCNVGDPIGPFANGNLAEVIQGPHLSYTMYLSDGSRSEEEILGYSIKIPGAGDPPMTKYWGIGIECLRRITDPDAEQEAEKEMEVQS